MRVFVALALIAGCRIAETRQPLSYVEIRKQGCVLQANEYSCGAASLATLMRMYGSDKTESEILNVISENAQLVEKIDEAESTVSLRPLSFEDMEAAARRCGFKSISVQANSGQEATRAIETLKPVIARLSLHGDFLHFVVIRDVQDDWMFISDPAYGNFKIPTRQFTGNWEAAERYLLAIGKLPFLGYQDEQTGELFLKRDDADILPSQEIVTPAPLYRNVIDMRRITK